MAKFTVLDTNHFRELAHRTELGRKLRARIAEEHAISFSCVVAAEESLQGWIAEVRKRRSGPAQVKAYSFLQDTIQTLAELTLLPFDNDAAATFVELERLRLRVGTMDLKIASICIAHDATLLTRNLRDFVPIPGLRAENWLD